VLTVQTRVTRDEILWPVLGTATKRALALVIPGLVLGAVIAYYVTWLATLPPSIAESAGAGGRPVTLRLQTAGSLGPSFSTSHGAPAMRQPCCKPRSSPTTRCYISRVCSGQWPLMQWSKT
jgi:hypothetical protein